MKKWVFIFVGLLVLLNMNAYAAELSAEDAKIIKAAEIPIYPEATFGGGNRDIGYRFATSKPLAEVRQWYREKLSDWSLYEQYGGWILYKGEKDLGMAEVMSKLQVMIQENENLPEWFSLDKSMTREIVIMIPKTE